MNEIVKYLNAKYGINVTEEELLAQIKPSQIVMNPMKIINEVYDFYDIDVSNRLKKRRFRALVSPKHISIYFMNKYTHLSNREIMSYFNQCGTMVQYSNNLINDRMDTEPDFKHEMELLDLHLRIHI